MYKQRMLELLLWIEFGKSLEDNPNLAGKYDINKIRNRFKELQDEFLEDYLIEN